MTNNTDNKIQKCIKYNYKHVLDLGFNKLINTIYSLNPQSINNIKSTEIKKVKLQRKIVSNKTDLLKTKKLLVLFKMIWIRMKDSVKSLPLTFKKC